MLIGNPLKGDPPIHDGFQDEVLYLTINVEAEIAIRAFGEMFDVIASKGLKTSRADQQTVELPINAFEFVFIHAVFFHDFDPWLPLIP